jgi:thiamine phosphate synthase YjbQ (UPF0047 family)
VNEWKPLDEGPDDMPAHVKSTLFGATLTVPVTADGRAIPFPVGLEA